MKRGTPDHPKVKRLAKLLKISRAEAVGILELLWHATADYALAGDIGRFPDDEIAEMVYWQRSPSELIDALTECRLLDRHPACRLTVHDWPEHIDRTAKQRAKDRGIRFVQNLAESGRSCLAGARLPEPEPEPEPAPAPAVAVAVCQKKDSPATESLERLLLDRDLPPTLSAWVVSNVPADDIREMLAFYDAGLATGLFDKPIGALKSIVKDPEGKWDFTRNASGRLVRPKAVKSKDAAPTKEEYDEQLRQRRANSPPADGSTATIGKGVDAVQKKLKKGG